MRVVAMINNQAKTLSVPELAAHIEGKSNRGINNTNSTHCATEINNHPGGNAAGGAIGGGVTYRGAAIYHASRNFGGPAQGCSVFFADSGGGTAKIIAVGAHIGQAGVGHPVYTLDWVAPDWGGGARWQAGGQVTL